MTETPIYDELTLEKLDTFDPVKCEIVRVCDNKCCRIECTEQAAWVGHWKAASQTGITLTCTECKVEVQRAFVAPGVSYYEWKPL